MNEEKLDELRNQFEQSDLSADIDAAEWDTKVEASPMVGITVRMPAGVLQTVRDLAAQQNAKPTALIRRWIEEQVESQDQRAPAAARVAGLRVASVLVSANVPQSLRGIDYDAVFGDVLGERTSA